MKLELKKINKLDGSVMYGLWVNDVCDKCFTELDEANAYYDRVKAIQLNLPPEYETLKSEEI